MKKWHTWQPEFCHTLRGFIFANGEILIISRGLIFAVASKAGEKQCFAKFAVPINLNLGNAWWKLYLSGKICHFIKFIFSDKASLKVTNHTSSKQRSSNYI